MNTVLCLVLNQLTWFLLYSYNKPLSHACGQLKSCELAVLLNFLTFI